jgi:hypothetical protein
MTPALLTRIMNTLAADGRSAMAEIGRQNQQILLQLEELQSRQDDLQRVNQELRTPTAA